MRVLIVEDGYEYSETMGRYLGGDVEFGRAGDGLDALAMLSASSWNVIFMDMRFDRAQRLLGDDGAIRERFGGDSVRVRRFLERHQGAYIADAIRAAGHRTPILFSYDFGRESTRWAQLVGRLGHVAYIHDTAGPADVRCALTELCYEQ